MLDSLQNGLMGNPDLRTGNPAPARHALADRSESAAGKIRREFPARVLPVHFDIFRANTNPGAVSHDRDLSPLRPLEIIS